MAFLAPLFLVALAAVAVPIWVHMIQRERRDIVEFPSLMFIQRIPYQSVERRRIHNWWLLALRLAALALIVLAFSRPFFTSSAIAAAAAAGGAREVVILLDRSASMGYGDRWTRAQAEARRVVSDLGGGDRATLVLFDRGAEETVRATSDQGSLNAAIGAATVSSEATRFAPALRLAQSLLSRSDRAQKEAVLITDFQRSGWERQEEIPLPEGAIITPVSVGDAETADLAVTGVTFRREAFSGQQRVTVTAALINRSADRISQQVQLELDDRVVGARELTLEPNASGSVEFDAVTVAESSVRGAIRAGTDKFARDNDFFFALSPSRPVSVLVVQADGVDRSASVHLTTALELSRTPPFKPEVVPASRVTSSMLEGRAVVIINDSSTLSTVTADLLKAFVERGGGLFIALGARTPVSGAWPAMPGTVGSPVERLALRGGTLGYLDYSHPVLGEFKDPRSGNFANTRFMKYRALTPGEGDKVLARFDDGGAALVERRLGNGRVLAFTSTLDASWNDMPQHGMFLPLAHEIVRYLARYDEPEAWMTVGRVVDISAPVGSLVMQGQAGTSIGTSAVVVSPSGRQTTLGQNGVPSIELSEQGLYSMRLAGSGNRRPYAVAVNLDPAETDLTPLDPAEFLSSVTTRPAATLRNGQALEPEEQRPADLEKQQSWWWFLLVAGLIALLGESVLSNIQSKRLQPGLKPRQVPQVQ
jgi:hypothetical protein